MRSPVMRRRRGTGEDAMTLLSLVPQASPWRSMARPASRMPALAIASTQSETRAPCEQPFEPA
jgi:hypothetical protein